MITRAMGGAAWFPWSGLIRDCLLARDVSQSSMVIRFGAGLLSIESTAEWERVLVGSVMFASWGGGEGGHVFARFRHVEFRACKLSALVTLCENTFSICLESLMVMFKNINI